jgi:hypothetical protein
VSLQVEGPAPPGDRPEDQAATEQLDAFSLPTLPGYAVLMITRYGMPRRKVYLDLGHARKAVARAQAQGRPAWLVLCELRAVAADLDLGGEAVS